ncbi:MAG: hypothetical protein KUG78_19020 [Kangiellaceae bacterium]|nr:hypothetical protein [Kangiellaceae bacterium]
MSGQSGVTANTQSEQTGQNQAQIDTGHCNQQVLHYCGHIISKDQTGRFPKNNQQKLSKEIAEHFSTNNITSVFGSVAAGADILIAEEAIKQGYLVNLILPFDRESFRRQSVAYSGKSWLHRFERVIEQSNSLTQVYFNQPKDENATYALCTEVAIGLAMIEKARIHELSKKQPHKLDSPFSKTDPAKAAQLTIWDGLLTENIAGTYPDMLRWQATGYQTKFLSSLVESEARTFKSKDTVQLQPMDIVLYSEDGQIEKLATLSDIELLLADPKRLSNSLLDLNHDIFGPAFDGDSVPTGITARAAGHIAFHSEIKKQQNENIMQVLSRKSHSKNNHNASNHSAIEIIGTPMWVL